MIEHTMAWGGGHSPWDHTAHHTIASGGGALILGDHTIAWKGATNPGDPDHICILGLLARVVVGVFQQVH